MTTSQNDDTLSAASDGENHHPADGSVSMNPNSPGDVARQADEMPQNQASSVPESPGDAVTDDRVRAPGSSLVPDSAAGCVLDASVLRNNSWPGPQPRIREIGPDFQPTGERTTMVYDYTPRLMATIHPTGERTTTLFGHLAAASRKRPTPENDPGKQNPEP